MADEARPTGRQVKGSCWPCVQTSQRPYLPLFYSSTQLFVLSFGVDTSAGGGGGRIVVSKGLVA